MLHTCVCVYSSNSLAIVDPFGFHPRFIQTLAQTRSIFSISSTNLLDIFRRFSTTHHSQKRYQCSCPLLEWTPLVVHCLRTVPCSLWVALQRVFLLDPIDHVHPFQMCRPRQTWEAQHYGRHRPPQQLHVWMPMQKRVGAYNAIISPAMCILQHPLQSCPTRVVANDHIHMHAPVPQDPRATCVRNLWTHPQQQQWVGHRWFEIESVLGF